MPSAFPGGFDCRVCGRHHDVLPLSYSVNAPLAASAVPVAEIDRRIVMTKDQCVIDERFHYLRGRFALPVHGLAEPFIWGVWARIRGKDFFRTHQLWNDPARVDEPMYEGLLNNELPVYGDTRNLAVRIQTMAVGRRPHFFVADPQHPLAVDIRDGITRERIVGFAEKLLHPAAALT
jgi:hypothetical protein